jgi:hypothetical protein
MKCGPFPPGALCCTPISSTTTRSDCLSTARHFPGSPVIGAHRFPPPQRRGRGGSPQFPGRPSARSTPNTPGGSSAPAPGSQAPSVAFAVHTPARHPLFPPNGGSLTTLAQASLALQTGRLLGPASHPASRPRTGASLPRTRASPRTGLSPAGRPELVARIYVMSNSFSSWRPSSLGARMEGSTDGLATALPQWE